MNVNENTAKFKSEHEDETFYFCNEDCKIQFDQDPKKYFKK